MLRLLIKKEITEIIRSPKFAITFGVTAILILLAFFMGAVNYHVGVEEYEASEAETHRTLETLTSWGGASRPVFLKPRPLHALVSGVSNDIGRRAPINQWAASVKITNSRFNAETIYAVFRLIDLGFVFGIALSLFAILFGFDAVNGERERGTLALAMANSVPRDLLLLGKEIGMLLALSVPMLIPILIGALFLPLLGVPMQSGDWLRLALVVGAGWLYLGTFVTLSVLVSVLTKRSSTSFLALLVVWIAAALVTPRLAVMVSGRMVDVPTVDQVDNETFLQSRQLMNENMQAMQSFWSSLDKDLSQEERHIKWTDYYQKLQAETEEKLDTFIGQVTENRRNRERRRQNLSLAVSRISPTAVFGIAATELAGSSIDMQHRFEDGARSYRMQFSRFVRAKEREAASSDWRESLKEDAPHIDTSELPEFRIEPQRTSDAISKALPDLGLLFLFNVVFFALGVAAFRRYDVRYS